MYLDRAMAGTKYLWSDNPEGRVIRSRISWIILYWKYLSHFLRFFRVMGHSSVQETIHYITHMVHRVNDIFTSVNWNIEDPVKDPWTGYGFRIQDIIIWNKTYSEKV